MDSDQPVTTATPIFFEALAEAAKCSVPDAIEHYDALRTGEYHEERALDLFLDQYVAHA